MSLFEKFIITTNKNYYPPISIKKDSKKFFDLFQNYIFKSTALNVFFFTLRKNYFSAQSHLFTKFAYVNTRIQTNAQRTI